MFINFYYKLSAQLATTKYALWLLLWLTLKTFFYYIGIHVLEKFGIKENLVGLDWFAVVNWLYFPRVWIEQVLHYITDGKLTLPQSSELLCHPEKGLNKQLTIFVKNINLFKVQGKKSLLLVSKLWQKKYETKAVFELISVWVLSCFWIILRNVLLQEPAPDSVLRVQILENHRSGVNYSLPNVF